MKTWRMTIPIMDVVNIINSDPAIVMYALPILLRIIIEPVIVGIEHAKIKAPIRIKWPTIVKAEND